MGLNSGLVSIVADVNERQNVAGEGINIAQRVMDFGDSGHILASAEFVGAIGNPAEFHAIGEAAAKHGVRLALYNYVSKSAGNDCIPDKLLTAADWRRPARLWLSPLPRGVLRSGWALLKTLVCRTGEWRRVIAAIDPRLPPDVGVFDLSRSQLARTPELRQLLLQTYAIWPLLSCTIVWLALAPVAGRLHMNPWMEVAGHFAQGLLLATLLGLATGLLFFVLNAIATLLVVFLAVIGVARETASVLSTIVPFLIFFPLALAQVIPQRTAVSVIRELLAIAGSIVVGVLVVAAVTAASSMLMGGLTERKNAGWIVWLGAVGYGVANFVMVNGIMVMRRGWWSRGFATGQIVAAAAALGWVLLTTGVGTGGNWWQEASQQFEKLSPPRALSAGIGLGMMQAVTIGLAFALAELLAGGRAGIIAASLVFFVSVAPSAVIAQNSCSAVGLCVVALAGTYIYLRRRGQPRGKNFQKS